MVNLHPLQNSCWPRSWLCCCSTAQRRYLYFRVAAT
jgi:hypothetical protein